MDESCVVCEGPPVGKVEGSSEAVCGECYMKLRVGPLVPVVKYFSLVFGIAFLLGYFGGPKSLMILGGIGLLAIDVYEIAYGDLSPNALAILWIPFVFFVTPWYSCFFWASAVFLILDFPIKLVIGPVLHIFSKRTPMQKADSGQRLGINVLIGVLLIGYLDIAYAVKKDSIFLDE